MREEFFTINLELKRHFFSEDDSKYPQSESMNEITIRISSELSANEDFFEAARLLLRDRKEAR